jgi:hypothetical protein
LPVDSKDKASNKTEAKKEAPPKPKEPKQTKVDLKYTERHLDIKPLDAEQIHQIKERYAHRPISYCGAGQGVFFAIRSITA